MRSGGGGSAALLPQGLRPACTSGRSRIPSIRVLFGVARPARQCDGLPLSWVLQVGQWCGVPVPVESTALKGAP